MINLKQKYFEYFKEINKIPRKSGYEKQISKYIIEFAKKHDLNFYTDEVYNVIIWKDATFGYENREVIGLQAHIDMVCEKEENLEHDFFNDEIKVLEKNGYLVAEGTTLGADNGIGVAYMLALLDSDNIKHPKIEAIFTTQEETTMDGVKNLDEKQITAKKIISFDNFNEGEIWIGSASSMEWYSELEMEFYNEVSELETYKLSLQNFLGGHSGMDIKDITRGNPIKIASELLNIENIFLNNISGGSAINVIPRDCEIIFSVLKGDSQKLEKIKNKVEEENKKYKFGDIYIEKVKTKSKCFNNLSTKKILGFIKEFENGPLYKDEKNNVIVSANFSKIATLDDKIHLEYSIRSNRKALSDKSAEKLLELMKKYNIEIKIYDYWRGYEQASNNELINIGKKSYEKIMKKEPNMLGVQACLECEFLGEKIPNLQYIALGTNIYDAHSPKEKVEIESINKTWLVLLDILENL